MKRHASCRFTWWSFLALGALVFVGAIIPGSPAHAEVPRVEVIRLGDGAVQPKAQFDQQGNLHLVYLQGDPRSADVYYRVRPAGAEEFKEPVRVNSQPRSGLAMGAVRGPDLAIDDQGTAHVLWIGSQSAQPRPEDESAPILYSRRKADERDFAKQRNLVTWATGVDGGAALAVDKETVYAVWHAGPSKANESARSIYVATSKDQGETFARELRAVEQELGACACCDLAAAIVDGQLRFIYRSATAGTHRGTYLGALGGQVDRLQDWELQSCPMSTFSLVAGKSSSIEAWEKDGQVYIRSANGLGKSAIWSPPSEGENRKHPAIAISPDEQILVAWTEGTAWAKGGQIRWQTFDMAGRPLSEADGKDDLQTWGTPAAVCAEDGSFLIFY